MRRSTASKGSATSLAPVSEAGWGFDGRVVVVVGCVLYAAAVALPGLVAGVDVWPAFGIPPGPSLFFDARNVTAALECRTLGYDPLVSNPCDPWGRTMFYPRVWLALRWLGLDQSDTNVFAVAVILLAAGMFLLLLGRISLSEGVVATMAVISPSVMFAVERTNMDLALFALVALAALLWRHGSPGGRIASPILVLIAALAKLYPVVALPAYLLNRERRARFVAGAGLVAFAGYAMLTRHDIVTVARTATQGEHHSYGARILLAHLSHDVFPTASRLGGAGKQALAAIPLVVLGLLVLRWFRHQLPHPQPQSETAHLLAFQLGALIYLGTFATMNSFDYRLVFLLLTLPQLFIWAGSPSSRLRFLATGAVFVVVAELWVGALSETLRLWDELASWAAALLLAGLLSASIRRSAVASIPRKAQSSE